MAIFKMKNQKFDASYVITLPRCGRLDGFLRSFPSDWSIPFPQVFRGIDANQVPVPKWWTEIPGMYGCNESHRAVIAHALSDRHRQILIFEDDCRFVEGVGEKVTQFLADVPDNWDGIMFGGQVSVFDGKTTPITPLASKCVQVERLHAYGLSRSGMEKFYALLSAGDSIPNDYLWGDGQESGLLNVYRIEPFVAFQADGPSAISERVEPARIWDERVDVRVRDPREIPVVSLVCPFEVMDQLRQHGIVANGGETPPQFAMLPAGRVESGERQISDALLRMNDDELYRYVEQLRNDTAYHRSATFVLWHPSEVIAYPGAATVEASTVQEAREKLQMLSEVCV